MTLKDKLMERIKDAMRNKDEKKLSTFRLLLSALKNAVIEKPDHVLTPEDEERVVKREIKKRTKSIEAYKKAQREDLAQNEEQEIKIIEEFIQQK